MPADDKIKVEVDADDARRAYEKLGKAGDKSFGKQEKAAKSLTKDLAKFAIGLGIATKAYSAMSAAIKAGIGAAMEFERTTLKRSAALRSFGFEVTQTSRLLEDQATALESVTQISDEVIRSTQAMAINLGVMPSKIDKYIRAATRMANVTGMDLNQALQALVKVEQGIIDRTLKVIPGISDLTKEQLKAGDAVDLVNDAWRDNLDLMGEGSIGKIKKMETAWANLGEAMVLAAASSSKLSTGLSNATNAIITMQHLGFVEMLFASSSDWKKFADGQRAFEQAASAAAQAQLDFLAGQRKRAFETAGGIDFADKNVDMNLGAIGGKGKGAKGFDFSGEDLGLNLPDVTGGMRLSDIMKFEKEKAEIVNSMGEDLENMKRARATDALAFEIDITNKQIAEAERGQKAIAAAAWSGAGSLIASFAAIENSRIDSWERQAKAQAGSQEEMNAAIDTAERKRFEVNKISAISQAALAGAAGVAQALASTPPPYNYVVAAIQAAVAAAQVAAVASQEYGGSTTVTSPSPGGVGAAGAGGGFAPDEPEVPERTLPPVQVFVMGDLGSEDITRLRKALQKDLEMGIGA